MEVCAMTTNLYTRRLVNLQRFPVGKFTNITLPVTDFAV